MRGNEFGIVHVSTRARLLPLLRSATVMTLVFMSVASFPGVASAMPAAKLWGQRFNGPKNRADQAYALGVSPDGSTLFVAGASVGLTTGADYATVAYDASTGNPLWTKRYNGPGSRADHALALGVSPDGSTVFVTGSSYAKATGLDYATVAYNASTGVRLWTKRYASVGTGDDVPKGLEVSPDGSNVFVTGWSNFDYATVAYDTSTGAKQWTERYDGPVSSGDLANALGISPDGSTVFVTGQSGAAFGLYEIATIAYDTATGAPLWTKRYNNPATDQDWGNALGLSPDGSTVFVTGFSLTGTNYDYSTVAFDAATGTEQWVKLYNGPGDRDDIANALGVSPDGSVIFVTGASTAAAIGGYNYATVAYDAATGAELWVGRYTESGDDYARALEVSPDGSTVFVTGTSSGSMSGRDYATVAYDTGTGSQVWARRYNGPGDASDEAYALGVSPDGSAVFVTGQSFGSSSGFDYATLAYSAV